MKRDLKFRISVVEEYLKGSTLNKTATKFNIHPVTLCRWVQWYKSAHKSFYFKPWNRLDKKIEEKVMLIKENDPAITLRKSQELLRKKGIIVSAKGIYNVWLRYNLAKRPVDDPFSHFARVTPEIRYTMECIRLLMKTGKDEVILRKAARILNDLPSYPVNYEDLIKDVPEKYLSLRRKFDRLYSLFLKIPTPLFYSKIRRIRKAMEAKGLRYSALIVGLTETIALQWMGAPKDELRLNVILTNMKGNLRDPIINFQLTFLAATAYSELMKLEEAWRCARKLKRMLKIVPLPVFFEAYGDLSTYLGDYGSALHYHQKALEGAKDTDMIKRLNKWVAIDLSLAGDYRKALQFLKNAQMSVDEAYYKSYAPAHALISFGLGKLDEALLFIQKTFEKAKKEHFRSTIFTAACCLAAIARGLGKKEESADILKTYLKLMEKYDLKREILIMNFLLGKDLIKGRHKSLPTVHLLNLLQQLKHDQREKNYKQVIMYAKKFGLSGYLHRCLIFFPELALLFIEKGKDFELPAGILKLPVFNEKAPVYYIQFLGSIRIFRTQKYLKITLNPLEQAILIHIVFNLGAPEKYVDAKSILENFWSRSIHPASRLAHVLVRIRKKLMMPAHLLRTKFMYYDRKLTNKGFYITSDYDDFNSYVAQAKALEHAGEWKFAREKYLRAFKLFRGEPFKKIYDQWSEDMRHRIIGQLESETLNFAKSCLEHGNKRDAQQVLEKVFKIISYSDEIRRKIAELCS